MFLGWFDVDVDPANIEQAFGDRSDAPHAWQVQRLHRAGIAIGAGPVPVVHTSGEGMYAFLEGGPFRTRDGSGEPLDTEAGLTALVARCSDATGVGDLGGGFALAIFDLAARRLRLATDRFALRPVYISRLGEGVVFGSNPALVASFPDRQAQPDPQSLFDYLHFHVIPGPRTVFAGVERLEPATLARFQAGRTDRETYWTARFEEAGPERDDAAEQAEIRDRMLRAVRRSVGTRQNVGAFLSGGVDSSTVAGNLARVVDGPAKAFSIGFDVDGYDETGYARTAARAFGLEHVEYNVTPADIVELLPRLSGVYGQPFGNSSAVPTYFCAKLAREHGVELVLGGDGGDELFGGNQRYAFQWLLGLYSHVPDPLARGVLEPLLLGVPMVQRIPLLKKVRSYVSQAREPLPQRLEGANLLGRLGIRAFFTADFLAQVDVQHPHGIQREIFQGICAARDLNRILGFDFKLTLADNDLPKVRGMSEAAGVDVHFPFLDPDVVDFSLKLPLSAKVNGTRLRPFFKNAMRGFLPDAILSKTKHGFGLPFGPWLQSHEPLRELCFDALSSLKKRDIVQASMIDALTGHRLREHAAYYGSAIWLMVVLELWMSAWEENRAAG